MAATTIPADPALRPDEVAIAQYRSVSRLSILALVLGLLSALGLANPLFVPIGLAAIIAAAAALWTIRASNGQLIGSPLALAGLCLGALFLGWCVSWSVSRQVALEDQARQVAEGWLSLIVAGETRQAHQFTLAVDRRAIGRASLARLYAEEPGALADYQKWFSEVPLKTFADLGKKARFRYDSASNLSHSPGIDTITLKFDFYSADKPNESQSIWIWLQRSAGSGPEPTDWKITAAGPHPPS